MQLALSHPSQHCEGALTLTGSKSETNRLLLLQALYPQLTLENCSNSDDSQVMQQALQGDNMLVDIHHAGTAMRFLTAFFAVEEGREVLLTGSKRMQERPIKILVEALRFLGADIQYDKKEGYPPLRIKGKKITQNQVTLPADVSSQYISALLLIAPRLEKGLTLTLEGSITSVPYIKMTLALLERIGIASHFKGNKIEVAATPSINSSLQTVESDWSSASYFFSCVALSEHAEIRLSNFFENSLQGDAVLPKIYNALGVQSRFEGNTLVLSKSNSVVSSLQLDLVNSPDIAQTIAVTCYGLGIACDLTGWHTLKIKETDRLVALDNELTKLGANIKVTDKSLHLAAGTNFQDHCVLPTYNDHRMAMAFAPLALKIPLVIEEAEVVSKSYPDFWKDMEAIGFQCLVR